MNVEEIIKNKDSEIQVLRAELNTYQKRCEQYALAYDQLKQQVMELQRYRFGKKSERFIEDSNLQLDLFGAPAALPTENESTPSITVAPHQRKKRQEKNKDIPRRIEVIAVDEDKKQCPCGQCKTVIRYETKTLLHYEPPVHELIEQRREVVACPKGCEGVITALAPLHILPKAKVSEEFLSFLVVSKMDDRQPLYHLEKQLSQRYGIDCSRSTMARWLIDLITPLQPIYNLMKDRAIDYDVASCDATTLQVLKEPNRKAETKSYVYCMRGGPPNESVILYDYNDREHKQFVVDWFEGFNGYLHVDGDNFFEAVGDLPDKKLVNCNSHARRKFEPIAQSAKKKGLAKEALRLYKALYKIERDAKNQQLTPDQRYALRQQESKPLLEKFKTWLDEQHQTVLPQSPLGKAFNYCINRWPGLIRFLDDGRLEIDNNLTEQAIKPFVIARKNFLFADSVDGANALCLHFSLVRTAKLHGHDPYHYYVNLLKSIPHCKTVEDYEKLLPWNMRNNKIDYAKSI